MFFRLVMCGGLAALVACGGGRVDGATGTGTGSGTGTGAGTGTGTGPGTGTGTGTGTGGFVCDIADNGGLGAWTEHPITVAGAPVSTTAPTVDAGIDDLITALDGEFTELAIDVNITGAIVTAVGYVPQTNDGTVLFYFEDMSGVGQAFYVDTMAAGVDPLSLEPGDEINMHATMGLHYFGTYEVTAIDSMTVVSKGNPVYVTTVDSGALDPTGMRNRMVEVWGTITGEQGGCGGSANCYDLTYNDSQYAIWRTSANTFVDDCVHYIGPLGEFQGDAQLNVDNFDWFRWW